MKELKNIMLISICEWLLDIIIKFIPDSNDGIYLAICIKKYFVHCYQKNYHQEPWNPYFFMRVLKTDKVFETSPEVGYPDCICSRCGKIITESSEDVPIIRVMPINEDAYGFSKDIEGGTEYRYCKTCCVKAGRKFN